VRAGCASLLAVPLIGSALGACLLLDAPELLSPALCLALLMLTAVALFRARYLVMRPHGLRWPAELGVQPWLGLAWRAALDLLGVLLVIGVIAAATFAWWTGGIAGGVAP
jgi:hypothetical protein